MLKFVMDAMHGVVYTDDKCVVRVSATKLFLTEEEKDDGEYTIIRISTII
jgi:Holliday junction resolvase RusA-like endonuclease